MLREIYLKYIDTNMKRKIKLLQPTIRQSGHLGEVNLIEFKVPFTKVDMVIQI